MWGLVACDFWEPLQIGGDSITVQSTGGGASSALAMPYKQDGATVADWVLLTCEEDYYVGLAPWGATGTPPAMQLSKERPIIVNTAGRTLFHVCASAGFLAEITATPLENH